MILTVNKREDGGNRSESEAVSPGQADSTPGLLHSNTSNKTKNSFNLERFLQAPHINRVRYSLHSTHVKFFVTCKIPTKSAELQLLVCDFIVI